MTCGLMRLAMLIFETKLRKCIRMGITIFKVFIWGGISLNILLEIMFYGSVSIELVNQKLWYELKALSMYIQRENSIPSTNKICGRYKYKHKKLDISKSITARSFKLGQLIEDNE